MARRTKHRDSSPRLPLSHGRWNGRLVFRARRLLAESATSSRAGRGSALASGFESGAGRQESGLSAERRGGSCSRRQPQEPPLTDLSFRSHVHPALSLPLTDASNKTRSDSIPGLVLRAVHSLAFALTAIPATVRPPV